MDKRILMKGNEAIGEAAILAGCRHYFAYPITPQNEIPAYMSKRLPEVGGTFLQAESEIAAVSMVMGASAAGARAMTSSSSPGIALKQEGISYLSGAQLPCVIVNMMRGGPGLGNIAGAQGDYYQATRGGGNGDYRTIVLAPGNVQELADYTIKAFELADKYRVVVLILGDGYLGQMSEPLVLPEAVKSLPPKPWALTGAKDRAPHTIASLRLYPDNYLEKHNIELEKIYTEIKKKEVISESFMTDDADFVLAAYGTSSRVCKKAVRILRKNGIKAGLFRLITLWPFPSEELEVLGKRVKKILTVEMSMGQMVDDVRMSAGKFTEVDFYGRAGGMIPEAEKIVERVKSYV
ncbi:MAG: 3-methyl-2-oxobutanoate dehydrogenase subunit VorB [Spirochaetia bacterium]|jgi:2-oxoglutarate ferredoxin oxidoreductase subunit alpha|nr:3-methyl-2-oxobutanoate dehydrogenase subunit VorB [Spirochaetia bacterium]